MEKLSLKEIEKYTNGLLFGDENAFVYEVVIDNRLANDKTIFIPIIGERFDGHIFMEGAYENGCRNFLCDKNHEFKKDDINLIQVEDTTLALGLLAKGYKSKFDIPFIGITGSVGKTSTKDIIYSVLKTKYKAYKTQGNLNNNIGLPRTLLNIDKQVEIAVIEMAMDKKGEMAYLTDIVSPNVGIITNIGMSHIENFENQQGIFEAKMELVENFNKDNILIINGDDKYLSKLNNTPYKLIRCGFNKENDIYCKDYKVLDKEIEFVCVYDNKEHIFKINNIAKHNILNSMFAIAVANIYGLNEKEIQEGLLNIELSNNRLDIFDTSKYHIINDTYNASYDSVMSALDVLNNFKTRKVAVLGDICELGKYSEGIHRDIGKNINCDLLVTIGDASKYISEEAQKRGIKCYHYLTKEDFCDKIPSILLDGDTILVKASHAMELDKVVEALCNTEGGNLK